MPAKEKGKTLLHTQFAIFAMKLVWKMKNIDKNIA
jgi:hypothetical protein